MHDAAGGAVPLTHDGRVRLLATPGHSRGHQSVVLVPEATDLDAPQLLFAGDAVFSAKQLARDTVGAICEDRPAARRSVIALRAMVARTRTLVLPSHDPAVPQRLAAVGHAPAS